MSNDSCMLLIEAYEAAIRLERNLSDHAGLRPMAVEVKDKLGLLIANLLDTSAIGTNRSTTYYPVTVDRPTWSPGHVTCEPLVTWTSEDSLDGKVV